MRFSPSNILVLSLLSQVNFKTGGSSNAVIDASYLTPEQVLVSGLLQLVLLVIPLVGGILVTVLSKRGQQSTCDCLTQKFIAIPFVVTLRTGEFTVWLMYFIR